MLKNYLITILRNTVRQKSHAVTNILGLTVGLASAIFIFLWINDEVKFDRFFSDGDRIYDIMENQTYDQNKIYTFYATPGPLAPALREQFPEVESVSRMDWGQRLSFRYGEKLLNEDGHYADSSLFEVFSLPVAYGNEKHPLPDNNSVAVSETFAKKYFEKPADAIGKVFLMNGKHDLKVTAVYKDIPENSSLHSDFFAPMSIYLDNNTWTKDWGNNGLRTYVKLDRTNDAHTFESKIAELAKKHNEGSTVTFILQPFEEDHLYGNFKDGKRIGGRIQIIQLLGIVAVFILVVACINFMNLATARALNRLKEVGLRKVVGATRRMLIFQFTLESLLLSFVSLGFAMAIVYSFLPLFNEVTSKHIRIDYSDSLFVITILGLTVLTGLLAGSYPSLLLSSFRPSQALKRNTGMILRGDRLRKVLVVFQFSLSVILVLCTITIYNQINFIRTQDLGFDKEHIIRIPLNQKVLENREAFRIEAEARASIKSVAFASESPLQVGSSTSDMSWPGKDPDQKILIQNIAASANFIPTMGMKILDGRNFSPDNPGDSANVIINEEAAKRMGLANPVGASFTFHETKGQIIGVVQNFHSTDMHNPYEPLILACYPQYANNTFIRIEAGQEKEALAFLENLYKKWDPAHPFDYAFLDEQFEQLYKADIVIGKLANAFTGIAIFISCLGLFGLASYAAEKRTKEIGVRKVLGASVQGLIVMLCSDFTRLVIIALLIGSPVAWFLMKRMLEQYAFHTTITADYFIYTALALLLIALVTVIVQSTRAALTNPVDTLRSE